MNPSNEMKAEGVDVPGAYPLPPDGVTLEQQDGSLILRHKETFRTGIVFLVLSAQFFFTILIYSFAQSGVSITQFAVVTAITAIGVYVGVSKVINVTTVWVSESEMVIARGPMPLSSTKRLPTDQFVGLQMKVHVNKNSQSYSLVASLDGARKPRRLVGFSRDLDRAKYYKSVLSRRLGLPEDLPNIRA